MIAGGVESISGIRTRDDGDSGHRPVDRGTQARALHDDDRHRRHRGRALRDQPRGAGPLLGGKPAHAPTRRSGPAATRDEIVPVTTTMAVTDKETGDVSASRGHGRARHLQPRPARPTKRSPSLRPSRARSKFITAGNASQTVRRRVSLRDDGGQGTPSALNLRRWARSAAWRWRAASRTKWASARCSPCRSCCSATASRSNDIGLWELNEAFASQAIYCQRRWAFPASVLNVDGGAHLHRPSLRHDRRAAGRPRPDRRAAARREVRAWSRCASPAAWVRRACSRSI